MLMGIPKVISPDLLKILCEMGHGDQLVIADGNFPSASCAKRLVRLDGHGTTEILEAILKLFPLDKTPNTSIGVMATEDGQSPDIWSAYSAHCDDLNQIERFKFYEIAKTAYCVIATSESALYANAILTKGVI